MALTSRAYPPRGPKTGAVMQLREAADVLGVHYQTAYGWVRQGVLPARKTARGYEVSDSDVSALAERRAAGTAPPPQIRVRDWAAQADRLHAAIVSGDETAARQVFTRLARGVPITDLCERVIAPALNQIGADWAAGNLNIATEHRASAICERLIAARARQPQVAVYMQQILEQYARPWALSREPTQEMKTTFCGILPSEGRFSSPLVGPEAETSRSNCSDSITSLNLP